MGVTMRLDCGGCDATATSLPLRRAARSIFGGDLCTIVTDDPESVAPPGWVVWDPYTYATYCPDCWAEIEGTA